MSVYEALAHWYDRLTEDVDYDRWADWLESRFSGGKVPVKLVLDLACGTGTMSAILAGRGYSVIGVDISEDMLAQAVEKTADLPGERPVFLCQSMDKLDLYGTVDACICCLDSINYVTEEKLLREAFRRVHTFLIPGGRFIFDINTPEKLKGLDGEIFLDETGDLFCLWRAEYEEATRICTYAFDLFAREGKHWIREEEQHFERAWTAEELEKMLREVGFVSVTLTEGAQVSQQGLGAGRMFFVAEKEEQTAEEFAAAFAEEYHRWERSSE